jgi:hypothetical protein
LRARDGLAHACELGEEAILDLSVCHRLIF